MMDELRQTTQEALSIVVNLSRERDAALAEAAALRQKLVRLADVEQMADEQRQQRDALREALEAVEWTRGFTGYCAWCNKSKERGHAPDCQRQAALTRVRE